MRVSIKGLINRLDSLRERLNDLFDKLEQEEIETEDVERYFQNDDTFNLSIALDVLEQADKLDEALEIIKKKRVFVAELLLSDSLEEYNDCVEEQGRYDKDKLTQNEYDSLKEILR